MISLSSHILDTHLGTPAFGVAVTLKHIENDHTKVELARAITNSDSKG